MATFTPVCDPASNPFAHTGVMTPILIQVFLGYIMEVNAFTTTSPHKFKCIMSLLFFAISTSHYTDNSLPFRDVSL